MGTEHYWIDPDHREALDLGKSAPGWRAHGSWKVLAHEIMTRDDIMEVSESCGDPERLYHGRRILRVRQEDIEEAQLAEAESAETDEEAEEILEATAWPWKGAVRWFRARDRENVFRTTHGVRDEPILFKVDSTERETGVRDLPDEHDGVRVTAVHPGWTLYTIYRRTGNGTRGSEGEFEEFGYQVYRYGGDPLYTRLSDLDDPDRNVPGTFDDILTKGG